MENIEDLDKSNYEEFLIKSFLQFLKERYNIESKNILKTETGALLIPTSIFTKKLGSLESIVKYLKEEKGLNYNKIAALLFRNPGPIGITYRNAKRKLPSRLKTDSKYFIPANIFSNTKLSVLENITVYLKNNNLRFHQIAVLLQRDDRTIWATYQKASKKLNLSKNEKKENKSK